MANTKKNMKVVGKKNWRLFGLVVILILSAVGAVISTLKPEKPAPAPLLPVTGNLEANMSNGGTVLSTSDMFYVSEPIQSQILRVEPGAVTGTPLNGIRGRYLNADDDKLYYVDAQTEYLMCAGVDGTNPRVLVDKPVSRLLLADDYLYYLDRESKNVLCRLKIADEASEELLSSARVMQYAIVNNWVVFTDLNRDAVSFYLDLATEEEHSFISLRFGQLIFATGDKLFYTDIDRDDAMGYITVAADGFVSVHELDTGVVTGAVADADALYYVSARDGRLYRLRYAENNAAPEALTSIPVCNIQLAGSYIYYNSVTEEGVMGCVKLSETDKGV